MNAPRVQTYTHKTCAVTRCDLSQACAITTGAAWHHVYGWAHYGLECKAERTWTWAHACPEHLDHVIAAVTEDMHTAPEPWKVTITTANYRTNDPIEEIEVVASNDAEEEGGQMTLFPL